jgi:hypothetical protein
MWWLLGKENYNAPVPDLILAPESPEGRAVGATVANPDQILDVSDQNRIRVHKTEHNIKVCEKYYECIKIY